MARSTKPDARALIEVRNSPIHGRGVYALAPIARGTRVMEYTGERITKAESMKREAARLARAARGQDSCVYIFNLNQRHDLDGRSSKNIARLINHSCEPNCRAETIRGRIWIIAKRDIAAGDELSFDYGFPFPRMAATPLLLWYEELYRFYRAEGSAMALAAFIAEENDARTFA